MLATEQLPQLRWLVLTNNRLSNLQVSLSPSSPHRTSRMMHCPSRCNLLPPPVHCQQVAAPGWWPALECFSAQINVCSDDFESPPSQDLDPLWTLPRLQYLSLLDNPVTKLPNYRCVLADSTAFGLLPGKRTAARLATSQLLHALWPRSAAAAAVTRKSYACRPSGSALRHGSCSFCGVGGALSLNKYAAESITSHAPQTLRHCQVQALESAGLQKNKAEGALQHLRWRRSQE